MLAIVLDSPTRPLCRSVLALALAIAVPGSGAAAAGANRSGEPPAAATAPAGRPAGVEGITSLAQLRDRIGRAPDLSEDGGACGGIVIHDWVDENLRVITQGDQVQTIAPLNPGTAPR